MICWFAAISSVTEQELEQSVPVGCIRWLEGRDRNGVEFLQVAVQEGFHGRCECPRIPRRDKGDPGSPCSCFMGVGQVGEDYRLTGRDKLRNGESPGFRPGREDEASGLTIGPGQIVTGHQALEVNGLNISPFFVQPLCVLVFISLHSNDDPEPFPAEALFQQPGGFTQGLEVLVDIGGGREKEYGRRGKGDGRNRKRPECRGENDEPILGKVQ